MTIAANQRYYLQIQVVTKVVIEIVVEVIAEIATEILTEVLTKVLAEVTAKALVVQLNQGVANLSYCYIVVQAGSGFNINTGTTLCLTVTTKITSGLGYHLQIQLVVPVVYVRQRLEETSQYLS